MQADFDAEVLRQKQREKWEEKAAHPPPQGTPQQGARGAQGAQRKGVGQKGGRKEGESATAATREGGRRGRGEGGERAPKAKGRAGPGAPTLWDAVDSECVIELPERYG